MSEEQPKISVIIPVYNVEKYLKECLNSVINQPFNDIEIICINDGSTDSSLEILNKYAQKDNRIKVISQKNSGLACSRNTGLVQAKGEYVFFLDSDDYLKPDILGKLYDAAQKFNADILMSKCKAFADDNDENPYTKKRVIDLNNYLDYQEAHNIQITQDNFLSVIDNYPCVSCGSLYKLDFLNKNNLKFINKNVIHEDEGFFLKTFAMKPNATFLNIESIMYRIRANSITYESFKEECRHKPQKQVKIIINDAIKYIKKYSKNDSKKLIADIKSRHIYATNFNINIKGVYTYIWEINNKKIKILGFPIYRELIKNNKRIFKFFGIPVIYQTL